jgi:UDP-N-acetylglucosamine 4,6-dehydratase
MLSVFISIFTLCNNAYSEVWPCLFTTSDTTGEKDFEEFFTDNETLNMNRFQNLGIIKNEPVNFDESIHFFEKTAGAIY